MNNHLTVKADNYSPEKGHKFSLDFKVRSADSIDFLNSIIDNTGYSVWL